ncbi:hypothetical protein P43SY_001645 [Pythium insidiosum]|uniref:Uncharacterized protein n=1 Tax=Pythium insidiosum TaxID=114742 RepID=A0AAD5LRV0_PYTIN|nr:hypothetical protein P43SY_001645 [Pythium insidiosum]
MPGSGSLASSTRDQSVSGFKMEAKEESERQVVAREEDPSRAAIRFVIDVADHDANRVYKFSEACAEGLRYQHHILKMPANPDSWFSLYELRKIGWPDPELQIDLSVREFVFPSPDEVVLFIEKALKACGYEARRRDNFTDAVFINMERMVDDIRYMVSLLAAEHEWETSIIDYKTDRKQYTNPKYFVIADEVKMSRPAQPRSLAQLATDVEMEGFKRRGEDVKQRLDLENKSDELATNYLYRLNAAAMRAGIDFRTGSGSSDLEEHIQQFFETLHDKALQMQFRFTPFESIDELEKKLIQYETAQVRPSKKVVAKKYIDDSAETPFVHRVDQGQDQSQTSKIGAGSAQGHSIRVCRSFIEEIVALRAGVTRAEQQADAAEKSSN